MTAEGGVSAEPQAWIITAHQPYLDQVRLHAEQTRGGALAVGEAVQVITVDRVAELAEAVHEMHTTLLRIAECEDLDEARALARTGATWG